MSIIIPMNKNMLSLTNINNENISSLLTDYYLLKSFIQSKKFEECLELYSIISNNLINNQEKICLEIIFKNFLMDYSYLDLNELKELKQIFEKLNISQLIYSYDLINQKNSTENKRRNSSHHKLSVD